jgi:hypothetical protein
VNEEEEDFVRWMDELDLEEVNLLNEEVTPVQTDGERERLSGERQKVELPPNRGVGWD